MDAIIDREIVNSEREEEYERKRELVVSELSQRKFCDGIFLPIIPKN